MGLRICISAIVVVLPWWCCVVYLGECKGRKVGCGEGGGGGMNKGRKERKGKRDGLLLSFPLACSFLLSFPSYSLLSHYSHYPNYPHLIPSRPSLFYFAFAPFFSSS